MCGRFTLRSSPRAVAEAFGLPDAPLFPRYNIAPTQSVAAIQWQDGARHLNFLRWGLVPFWAKDVSIGSRMINARADTVAEKPAYRAAFKKRRCLILADGFYEWDQESKPKQPYYIRMKDERSFAIAGLYEHWDKGLEPVNSCAMITTDANSVLSGFHDRMPVILAPDDYDLWLDPEFEGKEKLLSLLRPFDPDEMTAYPVSTVVNNARNESPDCVQPQS